MSNLKVFPGGAEVSDALGDAWQRAESYGRPELERAMFGIAYDAQIVCRTPTGSLLFAKASGDTPVAALNAAIDEAERVAKAYRT